MQTNFIKSPLNYTGNKYRILDQIFKYFPKEIDTMVDLFCGGATVGINVKCRKIIFIDSDRNVINLLKYLSKTSFNKLIRSLHELIFKYKLSNSYLNGYSSYKNLYQTNLNNGLKEYNSNGFYELRSDYNKLINKNTSQAMNMLYLLIIYGFNNDIRFSKNGHFNLPVGKTDLNKNNVNKLQNYIMRMKNIHATFVCGDFREEKIKKIILKADFVYMDPPYLITNAVYNETSKWNEDSEYKLINLMEELLLNNKNFLISNVLEKRFKRNEPLYY